MPLGSYRIVSGNKYIGPPTGRANAVRHINPKDIKSNQGMAIDRVSTDGGQPTNGSYGHAAPRQIFTKDAVINRSSGNEFKTSYRDYLENGPVTQVDDYRMGHWKSAGNDNPSSKHSIIPKMPNLGYVTGITPVRMNFHNPSDTPVNLHTRRSVLNAVDPNRLGYSLSKVETFQNNELRNLMFDKANRLNYEAAEYISFLDRKGFSIDTTPNPGVTALGIENGDFLAAYYHKQGYLITETNFQKRAKDLISRYGLTDREAVEAMKRSVLLHEFGHVLGIGGSRKDEKLQGELQAEFYSTMAERFKGTKMERIYRALAREGRDYAKERSSSLLELIASDERSTTDGTIEQIHAKFEAEATALGLRGMEFARHVNKRIRETYGAIIDGEPSYKESKKKSKPSKPKNEKSSGKNLEELVNDADGEFSFAVAKDGKLVRTYNGMRIYGENGKDDGEPEPESSYKAIDRKEYKSMKDVKEREAKSEKAEKEPQSEAAEAPAGN